jgi:hypothetical protein
LIVPFQGKVEWQEATGLKKIGGKKKSADQPLPPATTIFI